MDRCSFCSTRTRMTLAIGALITVAVAASAAAEGFRIATKVFVGKDKEPTSTTTTLFLNGVVYDFLSSPDQIAVFSQPRGNKPGRFILLDPERRVRTEFSTEKLSGAMENLTKWASQQKNSFLKFAANPKFDESYDKASGKIVLTSYEENYRIDTATPERPEAMGEYREFLDWYTKLNTLLEAGPPPGPRLQVNAALAKHKVIPTRVELTRQGDDKPVRAEHDFTWRLSQADLKKIDDANASLAAYQSVENEEFVHGMRAAEAEAAEATKPAPDEKKK
jgi:hypothetical protein